MSDAPPKLRIAIALAGIHRVVRGAETAMEQLAHELALLGHEVMVFGSGPPRDRTPYRYRQIHCTPRERFERWPRLPALRSHYAWEELTFCAGLLRQFHPADFDLTIACSYPFTNWVLRRRGAKHVFITQNGDWMAQAPNAEYRFFHCDGLVCTNPQYFERNRQRYNAALIPNGVDPAIFFPGPADRAAYGLPADVPIALMVSALIPSKHVLQGVQAVAAMPDLFLAVAGDGECRDEIDRQAARLLPGRYRRFTLPRERMPGLYRCADAFLHLSRDEPSANSYIEALASGLPIVTHDWEVTRWTLEDTAVLVNAQDTSAVTASLRQALGLKSPEHISQRRRLVESRFTWSSIAREYSRFFQTVVSPASVSNPAAPAEHLPNVGVVAIGRNEGDRLKRCLQSVRNQAAAVVYVDSASSDGSADLARDLGCEVVQLDSTHAFTAARARNAGFDRLLEIAPQTRFVQFVDGDCEVVPGWMQRAAQALESDPILAVACGRRRERFPRASIYNRLCDIEWDTPVGRAKSCGGDAMIRAAALRQVNGYNAEIIAGEEPELCVRLRKACWKIMRLDSEMTLHDAAMTRFSQWWKRSVRAGHAYAEGFARHGGPPERFNRRQVRSILFWGAIVPMAIALSLALSLWRTPLAIASAFLGIGYILLGWRVYRGKRRVGLEARFALLYAASVAVGKLPQALGAMKYFRNRRLGKSTQLIEYKGAAQAASTPAPLSHATPAQDAA